MPVYAPAPRFADQRRHPRALLLIIGVHALALGALMTAKMDLPERLMPTPTQVRLIPLPDDPPPPPPPQPEVQPQPRESRIDRVPVIVPIPQPDAPQVDPVPIPIPMPSPGDLIGPSVEPTPPPQPYVQPQPQPRAEPVRVGPRFDTPQSRLRPPYPPSKLRMEEEATLRLRLNINAQGRVTAVEPVGRADPAFLEAARRHLIAHWRYKPATEDGRAVASTTVISLRFKLED